MNFERITACGECCDGCPKHRDGFCQGCRETDGHCAEWKESGGCSIHRCVSEHGTLFCGLCEAFPCDKLAKTIVWRENVVEEMKALVRAYRDEMRADDSQKGIVKTIFCQSCGMPLKMSEDYGTQRDGGKSEEYCRYCYQNGTFVADCTMDEMIEFCITPMQTAHPEMSAAEIRTGMQAFFPTLKRWK